MGTRWSLAFQIDHFYFVHSTPFSASWWQLTVHDLPNQYAAKFIDCGIQSRNFSIHLNLPFGMIKLSQNRMYAIIHLITIVFFHKSNLFIPSSKLKTSLSGSKIYSDELRYCLWHQMIRFHLRMVLDIMLWYCLYSDMIWVTKLCKKGPAESLLTCMLNFVLSKG